MFDLIKEWYGIFAAIFMALFGASVWIARLEYKVGEIERKEKIDPSIRKAEFEIFIESERTSDKLRLENLASDVHHLKEIVENNHRDIMSRLRHPVDN